MRPASPLAGGHHVPESERSCPSAEERFAMQPGASRASARHSGGALNAGVLRTLRRNAKILAPNRFLQNAVFLMAPPSSSVRGPALRGQARGLVSFQRAPQASRKGEQGEGLSHGMIGGAAILGLHSSRSVREGGGEPKAARSGPAPGSAPGSPVDWWGATGHYQGLEFSEVRGYRATP